MSGDSWFGAALLVVALIVLVVATAAETEKEFKKTWAWSDVPLSVALL